MMSKKQQLGQLKNQLNQIKSDLNQSMVYANEFLLWDLKDTTFYVSHHTANTDLLFQTIDKIKDELSQLRQDHYLIDSDVDLSLAVIEVGVNEVEQAFNEMMKLTIAKGFYNYGTVGKFRKEAHFVEENFTPYVGLDNLLMLRRHEKDYLLRSNPIYLSKFNQKMSKVLSEIGKSGLATTEKIEVIKHLSEYRRIFVQYHWQDQMLSGKNGALIKFKQANQALFFEISTSKDLLTIHTAFLDNRYTIYLIGITVFLITLSFVMIYQLSRSLTSPIRKLSAGLSHFVESDFESKSYLGSRKRKDEMGSLINNFYRLQTEIADTFRKYREEAEVKHNKLLRQKERIEIQKFLLNEHRTLLSETNNRIQQSLNYARKIQQSLLPNLEEVKNNFAVFELWYKPKEQVSGDFYWTHTKDEYVYVALADCTGHGVPGAILSVLGLTLLDNAVLQRDLDLPSEILSYANAEIIRILNKELTENALYDSIDITIARFDTKRKEIVICSANKDYIVVTDKDIKRNKPSRCSVGSSHLYGYSGNFYEDEIFNYKDVKALILYSDGVVDQFSERSNKKFKFKRLAEVIQKGGSLSEVVTRLKMDWTRWKGSMEQTDDITLLAISTDHSKLLNHSKRDKKEQEVFTSDVPQI